jgi:cell shape-determining protein MreC
MTYLSGRNNKKRKLVQYGVLFVVFSIVVIFWSSIRIFLQPITSPIALSYKSFTRSVAHFPEFFNVYTASNHDLVQKNKALEITVERLENELADKNGKLKEYFPMTETGSTTKIAQGVLVLYPLMQDITKIYSTILLSRGFKDGVEVNEYVYVRGMQPVCLIKEVYTETSLCQLLSASGVVTDAVIISATSTFTVSLVGRGGGFLADVARDTPISVGDNVYLRSNPSMKLGTVVSVLHNNQDTSWHVFVKGTYNPISSSLFYVQK